MMQFKDVGILNIIDTQKEKKQQQMDTNGKDLELSLETIFLMEL